MAPVIPPLDRRSLRTYPLSGADSLKLGNPVPDWDTNFESHFAYKGLAVKITNSSFGIVSKVKGLETVLVKTITAIR
jgi:hypothetical protein